MIVILADEEKHGIGEKLHAALAEKGVQAEYIPLDNVQVQPCTNCGACTRKTPGRCAVRDDGDWIYPKVAAADTVVVVTPVVFGGYSVKAKRVVDKFGLFMDNHYFVQNGELAKGGLPGHRFRYFAIGTGNVTGKEAEVFTKLIQETVIITRGAGRAVLADEWLDDLAIGRIAEEVSRA